VFSWLAVTLNYLVLFDYNARGSNTSTEADWIQMVKVALLLKLYSIC